MLPVLVLLATVGLSSAAGNGTSNIGVKYDSRSLIVNGKRELFFSGSLHYPRITTKVF